LTEYADPDLETIAPLPRVDEAPPTEPVDEPPGRDGRSPTVLIVCLVVVALVTGFGLTSLILNVTDSGSQPVAVSPGTTVPSSGAAPGTTTPGPTLPPDPNEDVLAGLIVNQGDVAAKYTVHHPASGINMAAATLDLCNGTYPSEVHRTARRQVYVGLTSDPTNTSFSTEAVLYRTPADAAQAMQELRSVVATCPPTPVKSPIGEPDVITKFSAPPDAAWGNTPSVQRQAYAFVTTDPQTGESAPGIAVYLRRGRALLGLYFSNPTGAQIPIDGQKTMKQIVSVFESRMAQLPQSVVDG
jgi:hypothetical protein